MAVAAMLLPLGVGLLRDAGLGRGESNFGRALMIATAFGPLIGGIATPAGTAANLVAIAQLEAAGAASTCRSCAGWCYGVPASLLMIPFGVAAAAVALSAGDRSAAVQRRGRSAAAARARTAAVRPNAARCSIFRRRDRPLAARRRCSAAWTRRAHRAAGRGRGAGRRARAVPAGHPRADVEGGRSATSSGAG